MSDPEIDLELQEMEQTLQKLQPRSAAVNRDAVVFRAGEESIRRRLRRWQTTAASLALLLAAGTAWWMGRPGPSPENRIVHVPQKQPAAPQPKDEPKPQPRRDRVRPMESTPRSYAAPNVAYYRLQRHVLRWGFDGLPELPTPPPSDQRQPTFGELRGMQPVVAQEQSFISSWLSPFEQE